jgi:hypothetical protein
VIQHQVVPFEWDEAFGVLITAVVLAVAAAIALWFTTWNDKRKANKHLNKKSGWRTKP